MCQHEQVNKFLHHFLKRNAVWTVFEQLYVVILVEGGKLEKNQSFQKIEFVHGEEEIFFNFFWTTF